LPAFADWHFDWLDVAELIRSTDTVLAYPMVDRDPLPRWSFGRVTLLGDAAHPMLPRGSNGAGQAILDAICLAERLAARGVGPEALTEYDAIRNAATAKVVLANRTTPPDAILREVTSAPATSRSRASRTSSRARRWRRSPRPTNRVAGLKPPADEPRRLP
jgi:2-polyprenyl-6-methoxyphenol hydroxylase-like FAD-dependent oxidoreductase